MPGSHRLGLTSPWMVIGLTCQQARKTQRHADQWRGTCRGSLGCDARQVETDCKSSSAGRIPARLTVPSESLWQRATSMRNSCSTQACVARLSASRLGEGAVTFAWKDYRHESKNKTMRLDAHEFIRRFLLHVLPSGFQRIRSYGFLANRYRQVKIDLCRQLLGAPVPVAAVDVLDQTLDYRDRYQRLTGLSLRDCPHCSKGQMVRIESFTAGVSPRGPPAKTS